MPGVWQALGLPGIVDVHVHFMPKNVMDKVWAYFDGVGPLTGVPWPVAYRTQEQDRLARLRAMGVRAFPSLVYPHRPRMAAWLNAWASDFAAREPDVLHTATFFPEESAGQDVRAALEAGAQIFKAHVQVGAYDPRDPLLDAVWGQLSDAQVPVVVHCGNGPAPGAFTGPGPFLDVMSRFPRLVAVIAHMGLPDYEEFLRMTLQFERLHVDTTMAFTDFTEASWPWPPDLTPLLVDMGHRVLFGSDFPNTPYAFAHQVEALTRLDLGDAWLRGVLHDNASGLLALPQSVAGCSSGDGP